MKSSTEAVFQRNYQSHLKHLKLKGLQPKTIEAYSRAIRRIGERFEHRIDSLSEPQLTDYFSELVASHSWSTVKLDLYGLQFYYAHVLRKPWVAPGLVKPPKSQRLPDIVTVAEVQRIFSTTNLCNSPDRGRNRSDRGPEIPRPSLHTHHRPLYPSDRPDQAPRAASD
jgi:integrase/recombinase XerD